MARGGPVQGTAPFPAWCTRTRVVLLLLPLLLSHCSEVVSAQELPTNGVNGFSLHPPYFNLAENTKITATATCGVDEDTARPTRDLYCKLVGGPVFGDPSQTIQGQYCDICNQSDSDRAHPITNAIDGTERWWQSPPLSRSTEFNEVNVTLDLGQLFHVAYVLIKFANSPRPDLWVLERSVDFGQTYQPWQFFASSKRDCIERFGQSSIERISSDNDVICTTEYSRIVPLENGEVVVSLVNGRPGAMNFSYSPVLRDFTKATNIRLRFLRTNTLLGHLMGKALRDPTVTRRYYYSIKDISIGGRCVCNGHAEACDAKDPNDPYKLQCDCQHNTCGVSCDTCCPGYNQFPWKPATTYSANECEQCNCHRHSFECYFDTEIEQRRASLDIHGHYRGGGHCLNCQHHTMGVNCERCILTYYRSASYSMDSPLACSPCVCQSDRTDGTCEDFTGRCYCKPNFTGEKCDRCAPGYMNYPDCYLATTTIPCTGPKCNSEQKRNESENIVDCECTPVGTVDNKCRIDATTRTCVCKEGFIGAHCEACAPGFYGNPREPGGNCQACQCSGKGCLEGTCDSVTGHPVCRSGFQGYQCDQCAPGYYSYPYCSLCGCSGVGTLPGGCDVSGRCMCKPEFQGPRCEQCRSGFHSYPNCKVCSCDPRTSLDTSCSASGHCHCRANYSGTLCDQCAPGYYGYPKCTACQCSTQGSRYSSCDQVTGQCQCVPNVAGLKCDSCAHGAYGFPHCRAGTCHPAGSIQYVTLPPVGQCQCREYVEGVACDKCKPLYWNLSPETPDGCSACECNIPGTVSGVAECSQGTGQCKCRPNVCSGTCSACKAGYYNLQEQNYFGCQGCKCDVGGSIDQTCGEFHGRCPCRPNVEGPKCNLPRPDHYFPDLHHLKFEIEEGTTLDGRPVRFGYSPVEFKGFSWRGYAQMSPIQNKVLVSVFVNQPDLYRVVFRYANRLGSNVRGRVSVIEDIRQYFCGNLRLQVHVSEADVYLTRIILRYINSEGSTSNGKITAYQNSRRGSEQSKQIVFAPSVEPTFVNVPQNNFVEPFVLNPGTWTVVIEAEGILLDYLVLLPSAYYEAPILQIRVTDACTYSPGSDASKNCLLYKYLSLDSFPSISGHDASCRYDNHLPRPCQTERITPRHPDMAICSGNDINVQLRGRLSSPGDSVLVVEYSSEEETPQTLSVSINTPGARAHQYTVTLVHCKYSFLCRAVAIDGQNRVAVLSLPADAEVQLISDRASFFLHKVFLVPTEQFTMEYVEPKVYCISTHGHFSPDSSACVPSRFQTLPNSLVLKEGQGSSVQEPILASPPAAPPLAPLHHYQADSPLWAGLDRPPNVADNAEHIRLDSQQNAAVYSTRVHSLEKYVFIIHYHQPRHPTYPVQVYINAGRIWQGQANASFCPHGYGCRSVLMSENQIILDVTDHEVFITIQIPDGKTLWLDYVLVVPQRSYHPNYLKEEALDKSYDFISNCGQNSFYINPSTASPFCLSSAVSMSAQFNNGALPCACHEVGAESDTCEAFGGQCRCRPHVIGRDCSMCATGFWGFPNCRPCNCGTRLCEPVTGDCICPPRTVRPECTECEPQTFGCHPLVGCEVCNCSRPGVTTPDTNCDTQSGQCRCKDNIVGRQCERCAPGFYGYPSCRPCDCNEAGTEEDVCNPSNGDCLCKENVQGLRCDQCKVGTFHLDPTNPKGCTSCFCFGATDRCRSSDKRRTEIMDMKAWVLIGVDKQEVPVVAYPGQDLVEADLSDVPDVYQDLHWHAPKAYLGDKVSSYGGYLRYRLHTQTMRGDTLSLPSEASRPDIILKGNQMTLVFMEREYSSPEEPHLGIVHIVEGSFRHAQTGNSVSRRELMMVLVGLESLQIRALHSQSAHSVSLRAAVLEGAETLPAGRHANNVEICMCPANYLGDSCQKCAPGYYRDTKGGVGKCVACNCHGHSDQCLDGSGVCLNCRHNTAGDHCEKCQGGFLGNNSLDGQAVSCSSCPCPLQVASNNFAMGCVEKPNRMQCLCMQGYAGPHCERCAPGYFGNPMVIGSTCQPCRCHDNTDPNMLFSDCHSLTGECLSCMHNTAGPHCEICAPGYYGDAIGARNCTKCSCSPCGTESCDPHTGQCRCKSGVTGPLCDRCEDGGYGFDSCTGCKQCECDASAALVQPCDPQSGQCSCRPGVNGPHCKQCAPGHWDYGPHGCKKCDCMGGRCDPRSGECRCADGLTGKDCRTCSHKYSVPVEHGHDMHCEPCDSCVIVLLEDLDKMNANFRSVANQLKNLNASSIAWAQLHSLNKSMVHIAGAIESYNSSLDDSRNRADMLEAEVTNIDDDIKELESKVEATHDRSHNVEDNAVNTQQRAQDLLDFVKNMTMDINDILLAANRSGANDTDAGQDEEVKEKKLREVEAMLREMRYRSCVGQKKMADREKTEAEKLLARVNKELVNRQTDNTDQGQTIKERLARFHSELMDLRDALNEAVNNTARADEVNNMNEKALEDSQRKVEELDSQQKEVESLLQMTEDDVAQVNEMLTMLQDSKEDYERLAAQLDGARMPLAQKVQTFAPTVSKIPLVEEAEAHAALLDSLANNLTSLTDGNKKDGFIGRAVNASRAYTNIINSVQEAENAAKTANKAAMDALENVKNQTLGALAESLRNHSVELAEEAQKLLDDLNTDLKPQVEEAERRLHEAEDKKNQLMSDLDDVKNNLTFSTDVSKEIDQAKRAAKQANDTATQVNEELGPIQKQLDQWQKSYGDANTTNDDINKALMEANKTVSELGDKIPMLIKKLDKLQNHSAQMPNISENINRIRQLIEKARKAASKVSVPVKFNGTAGVQVRTPGNLADLAAYTSLKFYITLPDAPRARRQDNITRQFVFYLGNKDSSKEFLGLSLEGKRLRWFFNIGGDTADVVMPEDVMSKDGFNSVTLERILQYGQMSMSSNDGQRVTKAKVEAGGDKGLLNLSTDDTVFYVGGYPDTFKPPPKLALDNFKGCIELQSLNEDVLSLYNFEKIFQLNTTQDKPCIRGKPVSPQPWVDDGAYFDGSGYAEVDIKDEGKISRFDQDVRLLSQDGVLILLVNQNQFLCVAVIRGKMKVFYDLTGSLVDLAPKDPISTHLRISDGESKTLEIIIVRPKKLVVRANKNNLFLTDMPVDIPLFTGTYFLGGVPEDKMPSNLKSMFTKQGSVKGCFRNVMASKNHIDLKTKKTSGISFKCPSDLLVAREAHFSGQSYLELAADSSNPIPSLRDSFYTGFGFRTDQKAGLMFYHQASDGLCNVFLDDGHVVVRAGNSEIRTQNSYNDDNSHYVALYSNSNGIRLYVDDTLEKAKDGGRTARAGPTLPVGGVFLGGTPDGVTGNLTGCISNLFMKRDTDVPQEVWNLLKFKTNVNVPLDCPAAKKPQQIQASAPKQSKNNKGKHKKPSGSRSRNTRASCQGELSAQESGAAHFSGSTNTYQRYDTLPSVFSTIPHISMSLRINSSAGLVLHVGQPGNGATMSLTVADGHLLLQVDGGKRKVSLKSRRKYNDDQWHTVFVKREGEKVSLIVDGINSQSKRAPGGDKMRLSGPLYVGGLPHTLMSPGSGGFIGCVRDLELNEAPAGSPSHSQGAVPCFQHPLQPGAYFSSQGGHMAIDESLVLGRDIEIHLEIRPISDSGLLLHAGTSSDQHLTLVLNQGQVTVSVNSGSGEFSTSFTPEDSLCNGRWHTVTVVKKGNILQLHVDAASEHSVGPKQSRSAGAKAKETVYLGGVPDDVVVPDLPVGLPSFHGCVRKASLNQRPAMLYKPLTVHGAVGTQGCPSM